MGLVYFAPHNDEVNYAQVAINVHLDWENNKYMSLDGRVNRDYKVPLHFWLTSLTVRLFDNPMVGMRLWSLFFGTIGFLFTMLLARRLLGDVVAVLAGYFIVFSEYHLYFDSIGLQEVLVYGLGAAYLFFLYSFLQSHSWKMGACAFLCLLGCLLTKASGQLWILLGSVIPLLVICSCKEEKNLNKVVLGIPEIYGLFILLTLATLGAYSLIIPGKFDTVKESSYQLELVHSFEEILSFPWGSWLGNFQYYLSVLWLDQSYLCVPLLFIVGWVVIEHIKNLQSTWKCHSLIGVFFFFSFIPLVLIAKSQAVRYFGIGLYGFYLLVAAAVVFVAADWKPGWQRAGIVLLMGWAVWKLAFTYPFLIKWEQTELSLRETPPGWANGSGMMQLIEKVEKFSPGFLILERQWGHPTTTIQIFEHQFPHLEKGLVHQDNYVAVHDIYEQLQAGQALHMLFDLQISGNSTWQRELLNNPKFCQDRELYSKPYPSGIEKELQPIVICHAWKE